MSKALAIADVNPRDTLGTCLRKVLVARCGEMFLHGETLQNSGSSESIHGMRVTARRIRTIFKEFKKLFPKKQFKKHSRALRLLIKLLGSVRENDILLQKIEQYREAFAPEAVRVISLLIARTTQERELAKERLLAFLLSVEAEKIKNQFTKFIENSIKNAMKQKAWPRINKPFAESASKIIQAILDDFFSPHDSIVDHPRQTEELHRLRLSGKPLRYMMELFRIGLGNEFKQCLSEIEHVIELMGKIHDCDFFLESLRDFSGEVLVFNQLSTNGKDRLSLRPITHIAREERAVRRKKFVELSQILKQWKIQKFKLRVLRSMELT
jgi:CHAD domain-containing protein